MTPPGTETLTSGEPTLAELLAGTAGLPFYRVLMEPTPRFAFEDGPEPLHRHLLWVREREQRGELLLCGPVNFGEGYAGSGMAVLRAASLDDARTLAEGEPYHLAGLRHNRVDLWTVNEGSLTVRVDLMDGGRGALL